MGFWDIGEEKEFFLSADGVLWMDGWALLRVWILFSPPTILAPLYYCTTGMVTVQIPVSY